MSTQHLSVDVLFHLREYAMITLTLDFLLLFDFHTVLTMEQLLVVVTSHFTDLNDFDLIPTFLSMFSACYFFAVCDQLLCVCRVNVSGIFHTFCFLFQLSPLLLNFPLHFSKTRLLLFLFIPFRAHNTDTCLVWFVLNQRRLTSAGVLQFVRLPSSLELLVTYPQG